MGGYTLTMSYMNTESGGWIYTCNTRANTHIRASIRE